MTLHFRTILICFLYITFFAKCEQKVPIQGDNQSPRIIVDGFYPESGSAGTMVTILGSNFKNQRDISSVLIGKTEVKPLKVSDKEINLIIPDNLNEGSYSIELVSNNANFKLAKEFKLIKNDSYIADPEALAYNYIIGTQ